MLQDVMDLVRRLQGRPLSAAAIAASLGLPPDVARHVLHLLVQRGRLASVEGCAGCDACPLHRFCAGSSGGETIQGYVARRRADAGRGH